MISYFEVVAPKVALLLLIIVAIYLVRRIPINIRRRSPVFVLIDTLGTALSVWGSYELVTHHFLVPVQSSLPPPRQETEISAEDYEAIVTRLRALEGGSTPPKLTFPYVGKITSWEIFFSFTTDCENDHHATLVSPSGQRLVVMDRGQRRCSGTPTRFSSSNADDAGAFIGHNAYGEWVFSMLDLDKNSYSGKLDEFWMSLTIDDNGTLSEHKVSLEGLPSLIPAGKP